MVSYASQKIRATAGREQEAGQRYTEIRDIINANSDVPFRDVILQIANIDKGSFYNYTSTNSRQYGCVSLFTAQNLSNYFNLPLGIFDCSLPFDEDSKNRIAETIRRDFKNKTSAGNEDINSENESISYDIIKSMNELAVQLNKEESIEVLEKALITLETLQNIAKSKHDILVSLKKLNNEQ